MSLDDFSYMHHEFISNEINNLHFQAMHKINNNSNQKMEAKVILLFITQFSVLLRKFLVNLIH